MMNRTRNIMVAAVQAELLTVVDALDEGEQERVLAFARALAQHKLPRGADAAALLSVIAKQGPITDEDAQVLLEASKECRRVDVRGW